MILQASTLCGTWQPTRRWPRARLTALSARTSASHRPTPICLQRAMAVKWASGTFLTFLSAVAISARSGLETSILLAGFLDLQPLLQLLTVSRSGGTGLSFNQQRSRETHKQPFFFFFFKQVEIRCRQQEGLRGR